MDIHADENYSYYFVVFQILNVKNKRFIDLLCLT